MILAFLFLVAYQKKMAMQRMRMSEMENSLQRELLAAAVEAQERERKRIASDLHDDVGALLAALKFNVMHLEELPDTGETQRTFLQKTREMLESGLDNVRSISYDLLPPTLAKYGLRKALTEWENQLTELGGVPVTYEPNNTPERLPEQTELALFRVVQELVSNSLKHADATAITISTDIKHGELSLVYEDNGNGFSTPSQRNGLGMKNIQTRVRMLDGNLDVDAPAGKGFTALVTVPLQTQPELHE